MIPPEAGFREYIASRYIVGEEQHECKEVCEKDDTASGGMGSDWGAEGIGGWMLSVEREVQGKCHNEASTAREEHSPRVRARRGRGEEEREEGQRHSIVRAHLSQTARKVGHPQGHIFGGVRWIQQDSHEWLCHRGKLDY
jgi:hypothetical protein